MSTNVDQFLDHLRELKYEEEIIVPLFLENFVSTKLYINVKNFLINEGQITFPEMFPDQNEIERSSTPQMSISTFEFLKKFLIFHFKNDQTNLVKSLPTVEHNYQCILSWVKECERLKHSIHEHDIIHIQVPVFDVSNIISEYIFMNLDLPKVEIPLPPSFSLLPRFG